jgi:hypothetical protein
MSKNKEQILSTLSDVNLEALAKRYNIPLKNIIMRDEANEINDIGYYIINLDTSKGNGTHWTCCYYHPLHSVYFDSYGFPSPEEIEEKLHPYTYNKDDIQAYSSKACGWFCIAFLKYIDDKKDKIKAIEEFCKLFSNDTKKNDDILKEILYKDI